MNGYHHSADGTRYNIKINGIDGHIHTYIPAWYHMIRNKIDIIAMTFLLKLLFLERIHVYILVPQI